MNDPRGRQAVINVSSRDQWEGFAEHRRTVSALLGGGRAGGPSRLCVLGVGNGNDLDLEALLEAHREVHLVDLDPEALTSGVARQGVSEHPGLRLHGGLDVSAMVEAVATWSPHAPIEREDLEALAGWPADRVGLALPGPYDQVASTCLLSPLINTAYHAIGDRHPRFRAVVRAIRTGHLRLLARLIAPGGAATLITDVASSDHVPALATAPKHTLPGLLARLGREGGHICGVHPEMLMAALHDDPDLGDRVTGLELASPWRWRLHDRVYLVWAMRFRIREERPR